MIIRMDKPKISEIVAEMMTDSQGKTLEERLIEELSPGPDERPLSKWSKRFFIDVCREFGNLKDDEVRRLECLHLPEMKAMFLVRSATYLCGDVSRIGRAVRTEYYVVDYNAVKEFIKGME